MTVHKDHIDLKGFLIMAGLTWLWGFSYPAIKVANLGFSPIFNSFLRSTVASALGVAYCLGIKEPLFHRDIRLFHGFMIGLLFGLEFVCVYLGLLYTDAARAIILVNCSPFVVAAGAFLLLKERLGPARVIGLILAFIGVCLVFQGKPRSWSLQMLRGDLLALTAAFLWGATTIYIKKYLAHQVKPIHTFLYQLVFSAPINLVCAYILEPRWLLDISAVVLAAFFYTSVIVAFFTYLTWFKLIHIYPVADLSVFTFLTPAFGVFTGALFLKEQLTAGLLLGLVLVCGGIYLTNRQPARVGLKPGLDEQP
ncbi:MAG: DMT family transporter [Thermodesulfobacteriota bacterium]